MSMKSTVRRHLTSCHCLLKERAEQELTARCGFPVRLVAEGDGGPPSADVQFQDARGTWRSTGLVLRLEPAADGRGLRVYCPRPD